MPRSRNPGNRAAEGRFSVRSDTPVPEGGPGERLNHMVGWCRINIKAGSRVVHVHTVKAPEQVAADYARFYFLRVDDVDLFRWRWLRNT